MTEEKRGRGQPPKPDNKRKKPRSAWLSDDEMALIIAKKGTMAKFLAWALAKLRREK